MTGVFTNPGNVKAESHTQREGDKDTGNGRLATNPGGRPGASSRLSEGTNPAHSLTSDSQVPHGETFLLLLPSSLWCFVTAAPASKHGCLGITLPTLHSSLHNHTQALGQMVFLGDCNTPWCLLASVFLPTHPLDKPLMRITFLRLFLSHHFIGRLFQGPSKCLGDLGPPDLPWSSTSYGSS